MKNKKGFSFIELVTTVAIIAILVLISSISYGRYKRKTAETWAKVELGKVAQSMKTARFIDDGFHQFIYMAGYKPKGAQKALIFLPSQTTGNKACCENYPDIGTSPCAGGFMHYNCQNSPPYNKTSNLEICDSDPNCSYDSVTLAANHANPLGGGTAHADCNAAELDSTSNSWCDCDDFTLVGKTPQKTFLTLNQSDILCYKKETTGQLNVVTR